MSGHKARIDSITALLAGCPLNATNPMEIGQCIVEFERVFDCAKIKKNDRKALLQVLHSSRATDGFLRVFVYANTCYTGTPPHSMGNYLTCLTNHPNAAISKLASNRRRHFQNNLVNIRNTYLHQPGAFPPVTGATVPDLLSEMEACVTEVLAL